ncbi:AAA family ATPase [Dietzia cinnamea]|uniref:AAA family ATPase n=3 Tax=Dietzia TaxID=37914 RepID=A0AAW5Q238_9ACTN|nr:AAA family ATPase [Dietzia cinnamea]MCT1862768.1 AAA family ATPase [Dietzia cinnamea]MCT2031059.1 AAA family ATPase [Dietzia cinnamea]MCT2032045.1 AAA family ATPase [Dietzia cinnamea]MCT2076029.1 AAA family ATPase [Dietzia cinnamea]MCT2105038.1 AAA family ATPase [Dietzia cinnamea]
MNARPDLDLTLRLSASAADSRRGIVRAHPEVILALGMREWDAIEIVGARTTGAVVAAAKPGSPSGILVVDEVVAANCGLGEDARVTVRAAQVTGAQSIEVQGLPPAGRGVAERVLRSALLGKVVRVGDSVTLLPRDLGPQFPTGDTTRTLRNTMGAQWSTELLTVTATVPDGIVSVQPTTAVVTGAATATAPRTAAAAGTTAAATTTSSLSPAGPAAGGVHAPGSSGTAAAGPTAGAGSAGGADGSAISAVAREDLVGVGDQAEVLEQWLSLALDRSELLRTLGASPHLGVLVAGPPGVGKATLVRSVAGARRLEVIDGPSVGSLDPASRLEAVRAAAERTREHGGILLVTDVDALLPAESEPVSTLVLDRLRSVVAAPGAALVATCVRPEDADPRLRDPDVCDRVLDLPLPDAADRAALLAVMLRDVPAADLDLSAVADRTPGYVAGDMRALTREAALRAAARATGGTDGGTDGTGAADDALSGARLEQEDLLGAISVIRPLSRSGTEELSLGSITLDDVGDMEEVRQALTETVLWPLQHRESFERLGVQPPRGVLLYGPPGCGKTFVVRALAASGRLTVHMVKGAELMDKWVGSSEKAVRDLFRKARDSAPSLVFLDEIDALAPRRGQTGDSGVGDRVVAALLTELDGAEPLGDVVILGATNRPELIDPAFLRPGRLERLVFVPPPDAEARADILRAAGRDVPLADDVDLDELAADLDGYSAADCAALLRESALTAMRRDIDAAEVTADDVARARLAVRPSLDPDQVENLRLYAERRAD